MRIDKFKGLNNQQAPTEFGLAGMVQAQNVDITDAGKVRLRNGRTKITDIVVQSAWSSGDGDLLYISNGNLHLMQDGGVNQVVTNANHTGFLSGVKLNSQVYWSTGAQSGVIFNRSSRRLGLNALNAPQATQFTGLMPSGRYMYAITQVRADGYESSAGQSGLIDITQGGIDVSAPVVNSDIAFIKLYLTTANGEVLYEAVTASVGQNLMYAGDTVDLVTPLQYQFCDAPPHFDLATFYRGRMYYAKGNVIYASKPLNYEMVDYANDYVQFDKPITMLHAVESGLFVSTTVETVFLSGNSIGEFSLNKVLDYGAIRGTDKRIYASTISPNTVTPKQAGNVVLWVTNRGLVGGFDNGQVANFTASEFAFDDALRGTSILREENGLRQLLVTLS